MKVLLMYKPHGRHAEALQAAAPNATFVVAESELAAGRLIQDADVVLGNRYFLQSLPYAQCLQWMQSNSGGVDVILEGAGPALQNLVLTCSRGVYDNEIAEHTLALILGFYRGLHQAECLREQHAWQRFPLGSLTQKRVLILGWGGVGQSIARKLKAFNATVQGVRRSHSGPPAPDDNGFLIRGPDAWRDALPQSDILILALPKTTETKHIVAETELQALPPHALVVNIGRGGTLCEDSLYRVLESGHLQGAALDVFEQEPLPDDSWIWEHDKVLITPHWARSIEQAPFRWEPLFVENLRRFYRGENLINVVDKHAGY